ncbi:MULTISPECIES: FecR family protein [unclassified Butyricimonas]|uniref:FecR family protein n=1 Tax=unclassified Butyricimonas TaxID=2637652 RepID=UPI000B37599E|nr:MULTISPECIES: FecR family protein [unclassified Butyricimonas]OUN65340.1 hypothetical protein B5G13_12140 [Butyricimonas sp. An62]
MEIQNNDRIKQLVVRYVKGELSEGEMDELERWRDERAEHEELFRNVVSMERLESGIRRFVKTPEQQELEWNRILSRTVRKKRSSRKMLWMRYAAMFILPLLVGGIVYLSWDSTREVKSEKTSSRIVPGASMAELVLPDGTKVMLDREMNRALEEGVRNSGDTLNYTEVVSGGLQDSCEIYHTLRVPRGGEYTLVLADGTTVYLNAESELRFPKQFRGKKRKVYLTGEGYFDVQRNEKQPFIVEAQQVAIRVLGTSFGVRAYTREVNVLTTLVQGRVNVEADGQQVELNPGQQADFNRENDRLTVAEVDVEQYVGWKDGRLVFDNKPLEFILEELGRWYSFDVFYTNKELKEIPYSLNIKKHEDIAHVLKFIERTGKVKFEVNKNMIIVK